MKLLTFLGLCIFAGYIALFSATERYFTASQLSFSAPLPAPVQQIALGFLQQLAAEIHFVRAAVFLGSPNALLPEEEAYVEEMARNFDVISDLYPEFMDAYYLAQSSLAHVSPVYAGRVNQILEKGISAYPEDLILPFFKGFNHFYYRDENAHAAEIFMELASRPDSPTWFGHLAAVLSVQGGDLYAGLMSLQVMHEAEVDEFVRERYAAEIVIFQEAIKVLEATVAYQQKYGYYPQVLTDLVPLFLEKLPDTGGGFELLWLPPKLRLVRPERED